MRPLSISRTRKSFLLCLIFFQLVLAGCAGNVRVVSLEETLEHDYIPLEEETWAKEQADLYHQEFSRQGLLYRNEATQQYLAEIKRRVVNDAELDELIEVYVIRSASPNAFAMPNGGIYIHSGLLTTLTDESQLAAIVAHETIHVTMRHGVKGIIDRKNTLVGAHVADFLTGGFGLVYIGAAANIMDYSRDQEREADTKGFELMVNAGYRPEAMLEAFNSLRRHPDSKHNKQSIYSSHPSYQERIATLGALVAQGVDATADNTTADNNVAAPASTKNTESNSAEDHAASFRKTKAVLLEESIKIRLRHRQFNLAQTILEEADQFFPGSSKVAFYRGEINMGFYKYPKVAAKEDHWIQTGKINADVEVTNRYIAAKQDNLDAAILAYQEAINHPDAYPPAFKRLGQALEAKGEKEQAISAFSHYLEVAPEAMDRRYVQNKLKKLKH